VVSEGGKRLTTPPQPQQTSTNIHLNTTTMRTLTFNALHNWRQTSQLWQVMDNLTTEQERRYIHWAKDTDRYKFDSNTSYKNILWYKLANEFRTKLGEEFKFYGTFDLKTQKELIGDERYNQQAQVRIHTAIYPSSGSWSIQFTIRCNSTNSTEQRVSITPRSNAPITKEFVIQEVFKYIDKQFLFPVGLFRNFQLAYNSDKKYALMQYKAAMKRQREDIKTPDNEGVFEEYLYKRYNFEVASNLFLDQQTIVRHCRQYVEKYGKPEETKILAKYDIWDIINPSHFDGDIDEAEDLLTEDLKQYPNHVFI
jgi:hypothetical protein